MDISPSEADKGELFEYSPKLPNAEFLRTLQVVDKEGGFEPPDRDSVVRGELPDASIDPTPDDEVVEVEMLEAVYDLPLTNEREAEASLSFDPFIHNADPQDQEQREHLTPSLADDSDPDDYEPPEPALSPEGTAIEAKASTSPSSSDANGDIAPVRLSPQLSLDHEGIVEDISGPAPQKVLLYLTAFVLRANPSTDDSTSAYPFNPAFHNI